MGFGDPDHQHPLTLKTFNGKEATCFRCKLPIDRLFPSYGCTDCNHFVHQVCFELPHNMKHPLHQQHPLTLFPSPLSLTDCSLCHDPCLSGYTFQCQICPTFSLHLKCFISLNIQEKHKHPLTLLEVYSDGCNLACRICGLLIDGIDYTFSCWGCKFVVHFECAFLPSKVKRHHAHELIFEYNYPKESDLSYCDVCKDRDDEEPIDRTLSYYYCKRCDYIAHVHCVTTKPDRVTIQLEHFVHEHPMIDSKKPRLTSAVCSCKKYIYNEPYYFCSQCDYKLHKSCAEFPRLIKHPHHKDHTLALGSCVSLNTEADLSLCGFCSKKIDADGLIVLCVDCDYVEHLRCAMWFSHPHHEGNIWLTNGDDSKFRCNACGELGHGYRMSDRGYIYIASELNSVYQQYDLHLECFALPGKIDCDFHSHPLFLITSPTKIRSNLSTTFLCELCHTEANPNLWIYCCKQCSYIAHLKCTVPDLLPDVGSLKDSSSLISITQYEKEQFMVDLKQVESICSKLRKLVFYGCEYPIFSHTGLFKGPKLPLRDRSDQQILSPLTDWDEPDVLQLHCPKCERPISSQAYSCITDWVHCNANISVYNRTHLQQEPLTLLDEKLVDQLYCPICNQLIFAPTYSCAECQIFFHKSCAEIPRKYTDDAGHVFVLLTSSMRTVDVHCDGCLDPIEGYAYACRRCKTSLDVVCALGSPLLKLESLKHCFFSTEHSNYQETCKACGNPIAVGSIFFKCGVPQCQFNLHFGCALLPYTKIHRIHHHPLVLEPCLDLSVDDYICDACEKELNPCLWAYRCSDSCGDRATSHVSCIVTSHKKRHFEYNEECRYPDLDQLRFHVNRGKKKEIADIVTAFANLPPEQQRISFVYYLFWVVDEIAHEYADFVIGMLKAMDQDEVLNLFKSPNALKAKVAEIIRISYGQQKLATDDDNDGDVEDSEDHEV